MAKRKPQKDELDLFVEAGADRALQLVLWKVRHHLSSDMSVLVKAEDLQAFEQSMKYQQVRPAVMIYRPEGHPATQAIPAAGNRRAVPARPAEPPRPYVIIGLVQEGTRNAVRAVENNEADFQRGDLQRRIEVAKRNIPEYKAALLNTAATGSYSSATLEAIAEALDLWSRA